MDLVIFVASIVVALAGVAWIFWIFAQTEKTTVGSAFLWLLVAATCFIPFINTVWAICTICFFVSGVIVPSVEKVWDWILERKFWKKELFGPISKTNSNN